MDRKTIITYYTNKKYFRGTK